MSVLKTLFLAVLISTFVAACGSAERRSHKSQTKTNKSQTELNEGGENRQRFAIGFEEPVRSRQSLSAGRRPGKGLQWMQRRDRATDFSRCLECVNI